MSGAGSNRLSKMFLAQLGQHSRIAVHCALVLIVAPLKATRSFVPATFANAPSSVCARLEVRTEDLEHSCGSSGLPFNGLQIGFHLADR